MPNAWHKMSLFYHWHWFCALQIKKHAMKDKKIVERDPLNIGKAATLKWASYLKCNRKLDYENTTSRNYQRQYNLRKHCLATWRVNDWFTKKIQETFYMGTLTLRQLCWGKGVLNTAKSRLLSEYWRVSSSAQALSGKGMYYSYTLNRIW